MGGQPFPRAENCRRHVSKVHKNEGHDGANVRELDMDEATKMARGVRKRGKKSHE